MIKVFIAGATGWAGSELSKGVFKQEGMKLAGGLSRSHNGKNLAEILNLRNEEIPVFDTIEKALDAVDFDVLFDYTRPDIAKTNILAALKRGKKVIVGTSGLTTEDYAEIEKAANENNTSVLAVGNFALTVVLLQKFAEIAAKYITNYEIIDYAHEHKIDTPSGTVRELAHRLAMIQKPTVYIPTDQLIGEKETRGAEMEGVHVHSVRLPGHVIAVETIFGLKDEKLIIRHDSGTSAEPYVKGALLAIEKIGTFTGLRRGLDTVMDF
ncbi:4-hydroxy-tetrahydrodipicolinate reductase [Chryseobacterium tongliaoense]|uniref:4-hydroxy-tetrahydrodipicolinate reductase n=1 Tax=Chryseobacterium tongliaoense TaxID=3240933 RepID=UPI0035126A26